MPGDDDLMSANPALFGGGVFGDTRPRPARTPGRPNTLGAPQHRPRGADPSRPSENPRPRREDRR